MSSTKLGPDLTKSGTVSTHVGPHREATYLGTLECMTASFEMPTPGAPRRRTHALVRPREHEAHQCRRGRDSGRIRAGTKGRPHVAREEPGRSASSAHERDGRHGHAATPGAQRPARGQFSGLLFAASDRSSQRRVLLDPRQYSDRSVRYAAYA